MPRQAVGLLLQLAIEEHRAVHLDRRRLRPAIDLRLEVGRGPPPSPGWATGCRSTPPPPAPARPARGAAGHRGAAPAPWPPPARRLPRWASIRAAVAASKRSRLCSRARASAPSPSVACKSRSKRAAAGWTGSGRTARPGSRSSLRIASWRRNITWKSGVEARLRSGESSSTSRSKGRSWCDWARERRLPDPCQELAEAGIAREIGAQHQGVDEEPDQPLGLDPRPVGDRASRRITSSCPA